MKDFRSKYISWEQRNDITILWLDREEKHNAVCEGFIEDIDRFLMALGSVSDTRVIVLAARGQHFCAGLDLEESKLSGPNAHRTRRPAGHGSIFGQRRYPLQ